MITFLFVGRHDKMFQNIQSELSVLGYDYYAVEDPREGLSICKTESTQIVLASENMQFMKGIQFLVACKAIVPSIQSVLCSQKYSSSIEKESLMLGIDRFLSYEHDKDMLWLKLQQMIKERHVLSHTEKSRSTVSNITIDRAAHVVCKNDCIIDVTPKEFEMLSYFLENKNRAIARSELIRALWDDSISDFVEERTVDVHIKRLRVKIGSSSIVSVRGIGYKWKDV